MAYLIYQKNRDTVRVSKDWDQMLGKLAEYLFIYFVIIQLTKISVFTYCK